MRTKQEIDSEYTIAAAKYGHKIFQMTMEQEELKRLFKDMATLNGEARDATLLEKEEDAIVTDDLL